MVFNKVVVVVVVVIIIIIIIIIIMIIMIIIIVIIIIVGFIDIFLFTIFETCCRFKLSICGSQRLKLQNFMVTSQFCVMIHFWPLVRSLLASLFWARSESSRVLLKSPRKLNTILICLLS